MEAFGARVSCHVTTNRTDRFNSSCQTLPHMPKVHCPECDRQIAMHELEAKTVAQSGGFNTRYRCPFCRADVEDVTSQLA